MGTISKKAASGADLENMAKYKREERKITKSLDSSLPVPTSSNRTIEKMDSEML